MKSKISKFLSLILRHKPETVGISLDINGWVNIDTLIEACKNHNHHITRSQLDDVVTLNNKQRFAISTDGKCIRANQGHSIKVDLGLKSVKPPKLLYHGTVEKFMPAILKNGLLKMQRHHVHLSSDDNTAYSVGSRRGNPVVLGIKAELMHEKGYEFFVSENGVWLTEKVPGKYLFRTN